MRYWLFAAVSILGLGFAASPAGADLREFRGPWRNADGATRGITRILVRARRGRVDVRVFGKCRPRDCDWGWARATAYADNVSGHPRRDVHMLSAVYDKGFARTTVIIRLSPRDRLRVTSLTRFTDGGNRTNYVQRATLTRVVTDPRPGPGYVNDDRPRPREDCVAFNPGRLTARLVRGRWKIIEGDHWILDFGANEREARRAMRVIRHYGLDDHCFVGRPDPSMSYFRTGGRIPERAVRGEDCVAFDPRGARVRSINGRWKIVDGSHWIMDFGRNEIEARRAHKVIRHHRATRLCFVGRPGPSMTYLRR